METYSAIILAGGMGTRLRPHTVTVPKPLLKVGKESLIDYLISPLEGLTSVKEILVSISYLKEQFASKVFSSKVCLTDSSHLDNMYSSFIEVSKSTKCPNIICLSSDIFFEPETLNSCVSSYEDSTTRVSIFLKRYKVSKHKKWFWEVENGILKNLYATKTNTAFDKFMIIAKKEVLRELTNHYSVLLGLEEAEFGDLKEYSQGWIYFLKRCLMMGEKCSVHFFDDTLINVNTIEDLEYLEKYLHRK